MHLSENNDKLIKRVRCLKGQLEGVERMLGADGDCYEVLQRVAACRGALNGLTKELIHEHIEHHFVWDPDAAPSVRQASKDLQKIIESYLK